MLTVMGYALVPSPASAAPSAVQPNIVCSYDESYSPSSDSLNHAPISPTYYNENDTPYPASHTFSSSSTGTVSLTVSASATVKSGVILAGVEATFGVSVTGSLSITTSNSTTVSVPGNSHVYAAYGVWRYSTPGTYYKTALTAGCSSTAFSASANSPSYIGWHLWV